jgi:large repetitive protein
MRTTAVRLPRRHTRPHPTRAARFVLPALVVTLATATATSTATAAPVATVTCGQTITTSVRLANDLIGCPDEGLVIGADDITVDLNGHTIEGDGAPVADCPPDRSCDLGVDDTAGHRRVTVRNGTIRGFEIGALADSADGVRLRDLDVTDNRNVGLLVVNSADVGVTGDVISANGLTTDGAGVILFATSDSRIAGNTVTGNGGNSVFVGESHRTAVVANQIVGQGDAGIVNDHSDDGDISANRVTGGDGMVVVGNHNRVRANEISDTTHCADGGCGQGISFEGGTGNIIERNTVRRTVESGIRVAAFEPDTPPAVNNVVRSNVVSQSATDAILVEATATGTVVERNVASDNDDDGIEVDNPATTLARNTADRNGDLGIEAIAGVLDGGNNSAAGNGNALQCTNLVCA